MIVFVWTEIKICVYQRLRLQSSSCGRGLCLCLFVCLSVCLSLSLCLCLSVSVSLSVSVCLCLSVCLSVCLSLSLLPLSFSVCACVYPRMCVSCAWAANQNIRTHDEAVSAIDHGLNSVNQDLVQRIDPYFTKTFAVSTQI